MTPKPEPDTRQSLKGMYIVLLVAAILAFGLHFFNLVRKPEPWSEALRDPLLFAPVGLMLTAWSGLLPAAKTGARRILIGLSLVCVFAGLVLAGLDFFRS
jgi:hypothetical protein